MINSKNFIIYFIICLSIVSCSEENSTEPTENRIFKWVETNSSPNRGVVTVLVPYLNNTIFAGCNRDNGDGGIIRTTNMGETWELGGFNNYHVEDIYLDNNHRIWASFKNGSVFNSEAYYYRSEDNGTSWIKTDVVEPGSVRDYVNKTVVTSSGTIIVGTESLGMYRSTNDGTSWEKANNGIDADDRWTQDLIITPLNSVYLLAPSPSNNIYRTDDDGLSWTKLTPPSLSGGGSLIYLPAHQMFIADCPDGVFVSTDNCNGWSFLSVRPRSFFSDIVIDKNENPYMTGPNGVLRSNDYGKSWLLENNGLPEEQVSSICIDQNGYLYAGMQTGRIFRTTTPIE